MCGIAGLIDRASTGDRAGLERRAGAMADAIAHRGPDGSGVWSDPEAGVALAHRRLAVIDLTPTGAQPMVSQDGRWVVSYNGEIYNAADIARGAGLAGVDLRGTSDTEVILESVARRGVAATLADLNGMYALALWDRRERTLHLVRDRLGIKPLFVSVTGGRVFFASELKALHAAGAVATVDPASVASFLRFGYVPAPFSIYREIEKVAPGEHVVVSQDGRLQRSRYWTAAGAAADGLAHPLDVSDAEAVAQATDLIGDAVARQMLSDVPLGAFLSGGIDSTAVTALMVRAGRGPVRTFSIGFAQAAFDESRHAAAVARHLGTDHTELTVTPADALAVVPRLADMYDEPFADSSQIPTHLLSRLTRDHVTVALSGDGGDELFAGYNRYRLAEGLWSWLGVCPAGLRRAAGRALGALPLPLIDAAARVLPRRHRPPQAGDKLRKLAGILALDQDGIYRRLVSQCEDPSVLVPAAPEHKLAGILDAAAVPTAGFLERMQLLDLVTYLPDDILQKVDRASMAVALECRPPLLDHRIVEWSWRLPRRFKVRRGETKWLLRRVAEQFVPAGLLNRPKMGFGVPLADWLRGPLRDWAEDLLDAKRSGSLIDADAARRLWQDHLTGRRNWAYAIWTILMLESWRRRWCEIERPRR